MSGFSASREQFVASLRSYTSLLKDRNEALTQISRTSSEMRSTLSGDAEADITSLLERRDQDCARLAGVCGNGVNDDAIISAAKHAAGSANDEMGTLARMAVSLYSDTRTLAQEILTCQTECEAILRTRIEATANAIRESKQRRKLDAAYGPACKHDTPVFLDKQR